MVDGAEVGLTWSGLPYEVRDALSGKLRGLWDASTDQLAFDGLAIDKQQALILILKRMQAKGLWDTVQKIENVYGEGGVGISFRAWPLLQSRLARRTDFTRLFANHGDTSGGYYEKGRGEAVLHFLFQEGTPRKWYVHFDLYSPVYSITSAARHLRHEVIGKITPDWKMIRSLIA